MVTDAFLIVSLRYRLLWYWSLNSLAPGGFENIFQNVFFKLISWIDTLSNSCETALRSMPQNPSDDKSTLVQVMAWCRQAASHYLSQCCPKSLSPYGVTRPQWVKSNEYLYITSNIYTFAMQANKCSQYHNKCKCINFVREHCNELAVLPLVTRRIVQHNTRWSCKVPAVL